MDSIFLLLFMSISFLIFGIILWRRGAQLLKNGTITTAVIVSNRYEKSGRGGGTYFPSVRFTTEANEEVIYELGSAYYPKKKEGKKVDVIYESTNPKKVEINSLLLFLILPRVFTALGITGLVWGALEFFGVASIIS